MLHIDLSHTSHSASNTGIQRVCRSLHDNLRSIAEVRAVCYDPFYKKWRYLAGKEIELSKASPGRIPGRKRGSRYSIFQKIRSYAAGAGIPVGFDSLDAHFSEVSAFLVPEVFTPRVAGSFNKLFDKVKAPKIAVFHDAVVLRYPDISPKGTVERMPAYLEELRMFDGIAANSHASKVELLDYWKEQGVTDHPRVEAVPLGTDFKSSGSDPEYWKEKKVLVVGTFEGRKNHLSLLEAFEKLWTSGEKFEVKFCGGVNRETGVQAVARLEELQQAGRPIEWNGSVSDEELTAAYRECSFTVYPSLYEGFGLPVLESLSFGKPCVCTTFGALDEASSDGGCVRLGDGEIDTIANGVSSLLNDERLYRELCQQISDKEFRNWSDYSRDIMAFADDLR